MPAAFAGYRVEQEVGSGAQGPVLQARETARDRLVAIKAFPLDISDTIRVELVAGLGDLVKAGLAHPSIVLPLGAGLVEGTPYLVQEFVFGESLHVALRRYGPAPASDTSRLVTQIAAALDAAADAGILHGRLTPRDLLVTPELVRVTGFGIAALFERFDLPAPVKAPYAAPERLASRPWDRRADVYALGAIAWELLTGRSLTVRGADVIPADERVVVARPDDFRRALSRALADDPADRFDSARDLAAALEVALTGRTSRVTPAAATAPGEASAAAAAPAGGPERPAPRKPREPRPPRTKAPRPSAPEPAPAVSRSPGESPAADLLAAPPAPESVVAGAPADLLLATPVAGSSVTPAAGSTVTPAPISVAPAAGSAVTPAPISVAPLRVPPEPAPKPAPKPAPEAAPEAGPEPIVEPAPESEPIRDASPPSILEQAAGPAIEQPGGPAAEPPAPPVSRAAIPVPGPPASGAPTLAPDSGVPGAAASDLDLAPAGPAALDEAALLRPEPAGRAHEAPLDLALAGPEPSAPSLPFDETGLADHDLGQGRASSVPSDLGEPGRPREPAGVPTPRVVQRYEGRDEPDWEAPPRPETPSRRPLDRRSPRVAEPIPVFLRTTPQGRSGWLRTDGAVWGLTAGMAGVGLIVGLLLGYQLGARSRGGPVTTTSRAEEPSGLPQASLSPAASGPAAPAASRSVPPAASGSATPASSRPAPAAASGAATPASSRPAPTAASRPAPAAASRPAAPGGTPVRTAIAAGAPARPAPGGPAPAKASEGPPRAAPPAPAPDARRAPAPAQAGAGRLTLVIRSKPTGATVTVDGEARGKTPLTLAGLAPGRLRFRLALPGYRTYAAAVTMASGRPRRDLSYTLSPVPAAARPAPPRGAAAPASAAAAPQPAPQFVGSLQVSSRPAGARVLLDGAVVGTTPVTLKVAAGERLLRLELGGYRPYSTQVRVVSGKTVTLVVPLEPGREP